LQVKYSNNKILQMHTNNIQISRKMGNLSLLYIYFLWDFFFLKKIQKFFIKLKQWLEKKKEKKNQRIRRGIETILMSIWRASILLCNINTMEEVQDRQWIREIHQIRHDLLFCLLFEIRKKRKKTWRTEKTRILAKDRKRYR